VSRVVERRVVEVRTMVWREGIVTVIIWFENLLDGCGRCDIEPKADRYVLYVYATKRSVGGVASYYVLSLQSDVGPK
jgi:hypothetical protein